MLSFQETINKTEKQLRAIQENMDKTACYHPEDASIYNGLSPADQYEVAQTLKTTSLAEILAKSSTTGVGGAAYLVAVKLHEDLVNYSREADITPLISTKIVNGWEGADLQVNIIDDTSYRPTSTASGGSQPSGQPTIAKATLSPIQFSLNLAAGNDLLEDNNQSLIDYLTQKVAVRMSEYASELALTVLKTATDGIGTVNGGLSGDADETKWTGATTTDIDDLFTAATDDWWIPNTLIITPEAWEHSVNSTMTTLANNKPILHSLPPPTPGFNMKISSASSHLQPIDILVSTNRALHANGDTGAMTDCVTILFDRNNALLTGRKRWLEIKNYAHPIEDLTGAVVSARQDSVTLYNDAIGVITET